MVGADHSLRTRRHNMDKVGHCGSYRRGRGYCRSGIGDKHALAWDGN
jgi:hypothetical protein